MADTNRTKIVAFPAAADGTPSTTTDNPARRVRTTNEGLQWNKTVTPSTEIQPNRNVSDVVDIGAQGSGTIAFELHPPRSNTDSGLFLESLMCNAWSGVALGSSAANITAGYAAATGVLTLADNGASFNSVGNFIFISGTGHTDMDGPWYCTASGDAGDSFTRPASFKNPASLHQDIPTGKVAAGVKVEYAGRNLQASTVTLAINPASGGVTTIDMAIETGGAASGQGFVAGQFIALRGMTNAANNGFYRVSGVGSNGHITCDVFPVGLVAEAGTANVGLFIGHPVFNGTDYRYFNVDVTNYADSGAPFTKHYGALRISQTQFSFDTSSITSGTHTVMGKTMTSDTGDAVTTDIYLNDRAMSSRANVVLMNAGSLTLSGMAAAKTMSVTFNNNLRAQAGIGSYGLVGIGTGQFTVTGSLSAYFQSPALYQAFLNNDYIPLHWGIGIDNSYLFFSLPKCRLTSGTESAKGLNQDLTTDLNFQAVKDDVYDWTACLSYFPYVAS